MRKAFFSVIAGVIPAAAICVLWDAPIWFWVGVSVCAVGVWAVRFVLRRLRGKTAGFLVLLFALGFCAMGLYSESYISSREELARDYVGQRRVNFVLCDFPEENGRATVRILKDGKPLGFRARFTVYGDELPPLEPGTVLNAEITASIPENTGQFNSRTYFRAERVYLTGYADEVVLLAPGGQRWNNIHKYLRHGALGLCSEIYGENAHIMRALLLGDKSGFTPEFSAAASSAGVSHIFAVSGMHLSFCVSAVLLLGKRRFHLVLAMAVVVVFMAFTGFEPSVVRAGIMSLSALLTRILGRDGDRLGAMTLALGIMVAINPCAMGDVGLQFSFCAVLGILVTGETIKRLFFAPFIKLKGWWVKILRAVAETVSVSVAATLFTIPLTVLYFEKLSLIAIISNIAVNWLVSAVFLLGLASLMLAAVWAPLGAGLGWLNSFGAMALEKMIFAFSRVPFGVLGAASLWMKLAVGLTYGFGAAVFGFERRRPVIKIAAFALCAVAAAFGAELYGLSKTDLRIVAPDIARGECLIVSADGYHVGYDCDGTEALSAMESRNIRKLDLLILSEAVPFDGTFADELLSEGRVESLVLTEYSGIRENRDAFLALAEKKNVPVTLIRNDTEISLGRLYIHLAMPMSGYDGRGATSARFSVGGASVYVPGAVSRESQEVLLSTRDEGACQVLVISGGASVNRYSPETLKLPGCAFVLVTGNRTATAPTEEFTELTKQLGLNVLFTADRGGTEIVFKNGKILYR